MIKINGITIEGNLSGGSLTIKNNKVFINGKDVTPESTTINIEVSGHCSKIEADCVETISVKGGAGSISTTSGDINVEGNVTGSISTMSGDVDCYNVNGNIQTMSGNIKHKN